MTERPATHPPGLLARVLDKLRGRDQLLIRAGDDLPLVVAGYPRGHEALATSLQSSLSGVYHSLSKQLREGYDETLAAVPSLVVAVLRLRNACGCLGHHHRRGTESRLSRRLAVDTGRTVGEIDLAIKAIQEWEPLPLSDLAVLDHNRFGKEAEADLEYYRFHIALLAVFLHELEHLSFPGRAEKPIRDHSNEFYAAAMKELVTRQFGVAYGI